MQRQNKRLWEGGGGGEGLDWGCMKEDSIRGNGTILLRKNHRKEREGSKGTLLENQRYLEKVAIKRKLNGWGKVTKERNKKLS